MRRFAMVLCAAASITAAHAGLLPERVATVAKSEVAAGYFPSVVIGVVDGDKSEVDAFGTLADGKAPDGDTVYEIGSITKTFTATILAQEVLAGRVTLDTPVAKLLPDFTIPSRGGKFITLGEIGTQRSGLPRLPDNLTPRDPANPYADYDGAKLKAFLADYTLPRDPGASYEYSNLGFGLLGYALAQSHHTTYGALVADKVLKPLGMTMSGTAFSDAMRAHLAKGHGADGKPAANWDFDALAGAGALRSTANDMLRYLKANMGAGKTPLDTAMKFAQEPRSDSLPAMRIGLAWMTTDKGVVWHNGGTGGYHAFIGFTKDGKRGVVVLANAEVSVDSLGLATLLPDTPLEIAHKAITLPPAALDDVTGTYKLADHFLIKIFRGDDHLYAQATGQGAFEIHPSAKDEFFAKVADIRISFVRDAKGAVTSLALHQNGERTAPKLAPGEVPPEQKAVTLDASVLADYVGKYKFAFGVLDVTLGGGQLQAQLTGQPAFPIFASAKDKFFYRVVEAQLDFERDASGKVTAVVLHQNGANPRAERVTP